MDRRQFLTSLFGAAGAAVVLVKVGVPAAQAAPIAPTTGGPEPRAAEPKPQAAEPAKANPADDARAGDEMSSQYYRRRYRRRVYYYRRPRRVYYRRRYRRRYW